MPDNMRRAMELRGLDPDEVVEKAAAISESGILDDPEALTGVMQPPGEEPDEQDQEMLFDLRESERLRDQGMERADRAAEPDWKEQAWQAIRQLADRGQEFTADDVWRLVGFKPSEPRSLGPLLAKAQKAGLIRNTGRRRNSARPEHHAFPCAVWEPCP